jgi:hypothetical protein
LQRIRIWCNTDSTIRLFADECIIYRTVLNNNDMDNLQKDPNRLGEWALENELIINPTKCKAVRFTKARVTGQQFWKRAFVNIYE